MTEVIEHVYLQRGNSVDLELQQAGKPVDITGLLSARLELFSRTDPKAAPLVIDSTIVPAGVFDWTSQGAQGVLILHLGVILTVPGQWNVRLVVFDVSTPLGLVWTHEVTTGCGGNLLVIRAHDAADAA